MLNPWNCHRLAELQCHGAATIEEILAIDHTRVETKTSKWIGDDDRVIHQARSVRYDAGT
jgi:hypothetical protein